ncbi:5'/3'-nucleotidase SurE [Bacillus sp. 03113]|uniref:5'/3'-nucleotidase SurE n=1 Tax=Bacillus sp. 03113 TaxID=2578211 RepID=UPI001141D5D1|nr:5'/3'-nucleotidase SurE [Bacillus sp. 03113]
MRFLVTNDDGIFAPGLTALVEVLQHFGEVYVVCPDQERSAISHSITLRKPLKATPISSFGSNVTAWAISGTPVDCVKLGNEVLVKKKIDFVISGINLGANLGRDIYYSGTISAAVEASLLGIASIAVSLDRYEGNNLDYSIPKRLLFSILEPILSNKIPKGVFLNMNLPYLTKELCKGVKVTPLDLNVCRYKHVGINDPNGQVYYWLKDHLMQLGNVNEDGDYAFLREGYVTITPLEGKMSQRKYMKKVESWFKHTLHGNAKEEISL